MQVLEHYSDFYHLTIGPHDPVRRISSGQKIKVTVPDCDGIGPNGKILDKSRFFKYDNNAVVANPLVGPFYVEDAKVGDTISVCLHQIDIDRDFGRTGISANQINIPQKLLSLDNEPDMNVLIPNEIVNWEIDFKNNVARLSLNDSRKKNIEIPLNPFIGCIAVAPSGGQFISSLESGQYGGNLDLPGVGAMTEITFPVLVEGAYLFLGDIHAAQGDGEFIGGGIEVGGSVVFSIEVNKRQRMKFPVIEDDRTIGCVGVGKDMDEALAIAFSQLVLKLSFEYGFGRWDAMHLLSQTVVARPGNFQSAVCRVEKKYIV